VCTKLHYWLDQSEKAGNPGGDGASFALLRFSACAGPGFGIGLTSSLFDRTPVVNLSAFSTKFENDHVQSFDTLARAFVVQISAQVGTQGIEVNAPNPTLFAAIQARFRAFMGHLAGLTGWFRPFSKARRSQAIDRSGLAFAMIDLKSPISEPQGVVSSSRRGQEVFLEGASE